MPTTTSPATAAERAYAATKEAILDGEATPGQMLSEGEIAERVGISRTPVREAFLRLQAEGWLRLYPKRGALVVPPDANEARDVLEARILTETFGAQAATADQATATDLVDRLQEILQRQEVATQEDDLPAYTAADTDFHRAIVAAAKNAVVLQFQDQLGERQLRISTRSLWRRPDFTALSLAQHRDLAAALADRDVEHFTAVLREHLTTVHREQLRG